jgi:hypothetical protein
MWETELDYSRRVNAQTEWFIGDLTPLNAFTHIGEAYSYNWPWQKRVEHHLRRLPGGALALGAYRRFKPRLARGDAR